MAPFIVGFWVTWWKNQDLADHSSTLTLVATWSVVTATAYGAHTLLRFSIDVEKPRPSADDGETNPKWPFPKYSNFSRHVVGGNSYGIWCSHPATVLHRRLGPLEPSAREMSCWGS